MNADPVLVRCLECFWAPRDEFGKGQVCELDFDIAAVAVPRGQAEPVLSVDDHDPDFANDRVSLHEAFDLLVRQHPEVLRQGGLSGPFTTLRVASHTQDPILEWQAPDLLGRRLAKMSDAWSDRHGNWVTKALPEPRAGPDRIEIEKLRQNLADGIARAKLLLVGRQFFLRLQSGDLQAMGVFEDRLADLHSEPIPARWWGRDIELNVEAGEIWELLGPKSRGDRIRRWSGILIEKRTSEDDRSAAQPHASRARISGDLKLWLERMTRRLGQKRTKTQYFEEARDEFGSVLTLNMFNEAWKQANIPRINRLPGRRGKNP